METKYITATFALVLLAVTGCIAEQPSASAINWGDDSSQWALDGDCDDPRFDGPGAHTTLLPEDTYRDATDCRALYEAGRIFLRANFQPGVTYTNPNYVRQNL